MSRRAEPAAIGNTESFLSQVDTTSSGFGFCCCYYGFAFYSPMLWHFFLWLHPFVSSSCVCGFLLCSLLLLHWRREFKREENTLASSVSSVSKQGWLELLLGSRICCVKLSFIIEQIVCHQPQILPFLLGTYMTVKATCRIPQHIPVFHLYLGFPIISGVTSGKILSHCWTLVSEGARCTWIFSLWVWSYSPPGSVPAPTGLQCRPLGLMAATVLATWWWERGAHGEALPGLKRNCSQMKKTMQGRCFYASFVFFPCSYWNSLNSVLSYSW